jgi:hypothetical protein
MTQPLFDKEKSALDEAELEALTQYLGGRMSDGEELEFEKRLETDGGFRARVGPVLTACYMDDLLPIEVELGWRLAQLGLIEAPLRTERPRRHADRRRPLEKRQKYPI